MGRWWLLSSPFMGRWRLLSSPFMGRWRLVSSPFMGRWRPKADGGADSSSSMCSHRPHVALVPQRVVLVLLAEVAEGRIDDPTRGVPETAKTPAVLETIRDSLQRVELDLRALIGQDPLVGPHRPIAADAARPALAARLVRIALEH